jgi:hypothetical protein
VEIVLAVVVGVAAFVVAALVSTAARSHVPPLRQLNVATVLVLGLFLGMSVIVGAVATKAGRRAAGQNRPGAY